jgi:YD repeat-containing protein
MRSLLTLFCCILFSLGHGQYYFNDMVSTQAGNEQYKLLRTQKIKKIKATSFEADNSVTDGFLLEEEISIDGKRITLSTATSGGKATVTNRAYELGKLKRTQSSGNHIETKTEYSYNDKGLLQKLLFTTSDTAQKAVSTEAHEWYYDAAGQPVSMLKIRDGQDTMRVELVKDEQGQVVEEHWKKKNRDLETYYYYYDANKRLTDIVRYNAKLKKLFPDYLYEYDDKGHIAQMTQVSMSSSSYTVWKYTYNEKGLKVKEEGFDKQKHLVGRIEYTYENN